MKEDIKRQFVSGDLVPIQGTDFFIRLSFLKSLGQGLFACHDISTYSQADVAQVIITMTDLQVDFMLDLENPMIININKGWNSLPSLVKEEVDKLCSWLMSNEGQIYCRTLESNISFYL